MRAVFSESRGPKILLACSAETGYNARVHGRLPLSGGQRRVWFVLGQMVPIPNCAFEAHKTG